MMKRKTLWLTLLVVFTGCEAQSPIDVRIDEGLRSRAIVGGEETNYDTWKGVVAVYYNDGGSLCTGTLIHPRIVLCAGHCVFYAGTQGPSFDTRNSPESIYILGGANLQAGQQVMYTTAKTIVTHPDWTGDVSEGGNSVDLSIIELENPINTIPTYKVRRAPETDEQVPGIIVGYGVNSWSDTSSAGIHRVGDTTILTVDSDMIEFGTPAGTCSGDSGGPLFTEQDGEWVVNGVASYVTNYCEPEWGHWNTSTVYYRDWIDSTMKGLIGEGLDDTDSSIGTGVDTGTGNDTATQIDTATNEETLECPWNTGYPCACDAASGVCGDGSPCVRWEETEYGVCAHVCDGETQDPACRLEGYGIAAYGGGLCVLRTDPASAGPDRCLALCAYKGQTGLCAEGLVCRDLRGNGIGLCVPPGIGEGDTEDSNGGEGEGEGEGEDTSQDTDDDGPATGSSGCGCAQLGVVEAHAGLVSMLFAAFGYSL